MFTPIHLLPQLSPTLRSKYRDRWNTYDGRRYHDDILHLICEGAGEDFLENTEPVRSGFLEGTLDLKGYSIDLKTVSLTEGDHFNAIDFSYCSFMHTTFINVTFRCAFHFSQFYNCTFERCYFSFSEIYGSTFDKVRFVECNFVEGTTFVNSQFRESLINRPFFLAPPFRDCSFDSSTTVTDISDVPVGKVGYAASISKTAKTDLFKGMKEAYIAGGSHSHAIEFHFLQMQAFRKHNLTKHTDTLSQLFWERVTGYGVRPKNVLLTMATWFLTVLALFCVSLPLQDAILLTAGGIFTFGANADLLRKLPLFYSILYILSSFGGISLSALFVTALVRRYSLT